MRRRLPLLLLLAAVPLVLGPATASAQDGCVGVVDTDGQLSGADREALQAAVDRAAAALDGRVVALLVQGAPDGIASAVLGDLLADCPQLGSDGQLAPDVVVAAVAVQDPEQGLYYGSARDGDLQPALEDLLEAPISRYEDGDYAGGLALQLDTVVDVVQGRGVDGNGNLELLVAGGVLGGGAALVGGGVWASRRRREREAADRAQAAAAAAREQASVGFVTLEAELDQVLLGVDAALAGIDEQSPDDDALRAVRAEVEAAAEAALTRWASTQQAQAERPLAVEDMTAAQAREAEREALDVGAEVEQATARLQPLAAQVAEVEAVSAGLPADLDRRSGEVTVAGARLDEARTQGWRVGPLRARLDDAQELLQQARADLAARRPLTAARRRDEAVSAVAAVLADTAGLPERRAAVLRRADAVEQDLPQVREQVLAAQDTAAGLRAGAAGPDVEDVGGHADRAVAALQEAGAEAARARGLVAMDLQDLDGGETAAGGAEAAAATATSAAAAVQERADRLGRLAQELPARCAAARARAGALGAFLEGVGADVDPQEAGLVQEAATRAAEVERDLPEARGGLLALDDRLDDAEAVLARVDTEVRAHAAEQDRLRRDAERAVSAARQEVAGAEDALARAASVVSGRAGQLAGQARSELGAAEAALAAAMVPGGAGTGTVAEQHAGTARQRAQAALAQAQADLEAEQQRRAASRRRSRTSSGYGRGPFGGSGYGGSGGFGGGSFGGGWAGGGSSGGRRSGGGSSRRSSGGGGSSRRSGGGGGSRRR